MSSLVRTHSTAWVLLLLTAGCTPPPHWIAVGDPESASILLFDRDLSLTDTISLANAGVGAMGLRFVEFGRGGASLYVADVGIQGTSRVSTVRLSDGQLLDRWELNDGHVLEITALQDSPSLAVTAAAHDPASPGSIHYLSAGKLTSVSRFELCSGSPRGLATLQEIGRGYVRCGDDGESVVDLDLVQRRSVRTVRLDREGPDAPLCGPGGISLSRTGGILFASCSLSGWLLYLDRLTLEAIDSVAIGAGISQIAVSPRSAQALVSIPDSSSVAVVDLESRSVRTRVQLGGRPTSVVISGDGKRGYVISVGHTTDLVLVDVGSGSIRERVPVPTGSTNLSIWPGARSPFMSWR
ncbi:MAG: hypothetical protein JSW51_12555 [Gemmatimonadota bacterium]|nr:MAG: hypothetical protein JSW51_12555 [Gemmatimonadota bacterium]